MLLLVCLLKSRLNASAHPLVYSILIKYIELNANFKARGRSVVPPPGAIQSINQLISSPHIYIYIYIFMHGHCLPRKNRINNMVLWSCINKRFPLGRNARFVVEKTPCGQQPSTSQASTKHHLQEFRNRLIGAWFSAADR